ADHHVHVDALAVEHLPHAQRRGALHRAGADHDGDALAAHAAKLATASSTPAKIFRMVAKPLSSSTLRTFGLMSARRRSRPRQRAQAGAAGVVNPAEVHDQAAAAALDVPLQRSEQGFGGEAVDAAADRDDVHAVPRPDLDVHGVATPLGVLVLPPAAAW